MADPGSRRIEDDARRATDLAILERFRGRHDGASLPAGAAADELRALRAERETSLSGGHDAAAP